MQREQDSFLDTELTQMANEIIQDWLKPNLDPTDSYLFTMGEENDCITVLSCITTDEPLDSTALPTSFPRIPSNNVSDEPPPIPPIRPPCIVDRTPLLASDSLNRQFPDIPTIQLPKCACASRSRKQKKSGSKSAYMTPPRILVPNSSNGSSISAELSPRRRSPSRRSPIPDFAEPIDAAKEFNLNRLELKDRSKKRKSVKHRSRKKKAKRKSKEYRIQTIVSPVIIDKDYNFTTKYRQKQQHERAYTAPINIYREFKLPSFPKKIQSSVALSMIME